MLMQRRGRRWLNRIGFDSPSGGSSICWEISVRQSSKGTVYDICHLNLRDCNNHISLEIEAHTPEAREQSRYKIDVLIEELNRMNAALSETDRYDGELRARNDD